MKDLKTEVSKVLYYTIKKRNNYASCCALKFDTYKKDKETNDNVGVLIKHFKII